METTEASSGHTGRRPHVVVIPFPARGHVNPMLEFSKMLTAEGVCVTFINSEHEDKLLVDAEREALQRLGIRLETLPDGLAPHLDRATYVVDHCESAPVAMARPFNALLTRLLAQHPTPSCIVADTWLPFTVSAASKFGLPHASVWTQSAAGFFFLRMVANSSYTGGEPHIPGAAFLEEADMNTFTRCYDSPDAMFRFVTGGLDRLHQSRWLFINTFHELEGETLKVLQQEEEEEERLFAIGPLLAPALLTQYPTPHEAPSTPLPKEDECLTWLNQFPPRSVLYVSFGTLAMITSQQIQEIALGLEATGYPFLWVTRSQPVYKEAPKFFEDFLQRVKERASFVPWVPQLKVLCHNAVGGFFTHGGWNSTLEGITFGVPMLGWPYFSDQPMNCKCIEQRWEVGLRLTEQESGTLVPRNVVETKVKELMSSHKFPKKAREWSLLAKQATLEGGLSFKNFQDFVHTLKSL